MVSRHRASRGGGPPKDTIQQLFLELMDACTLLFHAGRENNRAWERFQEIMKRYEDQVDEGHEGK